MASRARTSDPAVIEHRLLDLAYTTDSVITAPLLAYYAPCSIEDAELVLDRLVAEDRVRIELDEDGDLQYVLPHRAHVEPPASPPVLVRETPRSLETIAPTSPAVAAVLSLVVPGAGQLYTGRPVSAVMWFSLVTMGYLLLVLPGVLLHIACIAAAAAAAQQPRDIAP